VGPEGGIKPNEEQGQATNSNQVNQTLTSPDPAANESSSSDSTALPALPACKHEHALSLAPTATDNVASAPASVPAVTQALANSDTEPAASPMDVDNTDGAALPPAPTAIQNYQGNIVPMAIDNASGATTTMTSVDGHQEQTVLVINNIEGTSSLPTLTSAGSDPGTAIPMTVNSIDTSNLPAWLTGNSMLDYLHGILKESAWQNLVTSLLKFEMENKITGVCTSYFLSK